MAESKTKVERRLYTGEFQPEAMRLADSVGLNAAADRLGVPRATVGNWARRRRKVARPLNGKTMTALASSGAGALKRPAAELQADNARLRRELASLKLDDETLRCSGGCARPANARWPTRRWTPRWRRCMPKAAAAMEGRACCTPCRPKA